MRVLGLDVGDRRVGLSLSDPSGFIASGLGFIDRQKVPDVYAEIEKICRQQEVGQIVVGMPRNMNGTFGPASEKIKLFVQNLQARYTVAVDTWDERLSTVAAHRLLIEGDVSRKKRVGKVDQAAATFILQGYLDAQKQKDEQTVFQKGGKTMADNEFVDEELVTLTDDEGNEHLFAILDVIEVGSREYAILVPTEQGDEEDEEEAVILRLDKDAQGEEVLVDIEDDEEWSRVAEAWEQLIEDEDEPEDE